MKKETKHWITFIAPGSFTTNEWSKDCEAGLKPQEVEFPDNAYAFRLMKRTDIIDGTETFRGEAECIGKTYYHPDSKIQTLEEVKKNPIGTPILVSNMERNNWSRVIFTRWENWPQPYDPSKIEVL